jgi:hypothetical protein
LPGKAYALAREWMAQYQAELMEIWRNHRAMMALGLLCSVLFQAM